MSTWYNRYMAQFNSNVVVSTLRQVVEALDDNKIEYRFLGSVTIAAINGHLHRNLGDLDFIIDSKGKDILRKRFAHLGFKPAPGMFTVARRYLSLEQFTHDHLLGVGYFYGNFEQDGSFIMGGKYTNVKVDAFAVKKTKYTLEEVSFFGIPERAIATGVKESESNPKRKQEKIILSEKGIHPFPNNYIHVSIYGIKADWIYQFSMSILNIVGAFRVQLGLPFDPWR